MDFWGTKIELLFIVSDALFEWGGYSSSAALLRAIPRGGEGRQGLGSLGRIYEKGECKDDRCSGD